MSQRPFLSECPNHCPPDDAHDACGDFYRLVCNNPPVDADFQTYAETGAMPHADHCLRCGLSVFDSHVAAARLYHDMQRRHPGGTGIGPFIAWLELTPDEGRTQQTRKPPHHTWWMCQDTNRRAACREIVKDARDAVDH